MARNRPPSGRNGEAPAGPGKEQKVRGTAALRPASSKTQDRKTAPPKLQIRTKAGPVAEPPGLSIIGIGASAGGLAALEHFFDAVLSDSPLAFVVVTHQQPGHGGLLRGLLKKHTTMPVLDVASGMKVEPHTVYLSQAGKNLTVINGCLYVMEPGPHDSVRLPIDFFLRSLAQDRKDRAIGVVLSGTGTDGTLGLRAIKGEGGLTLVQLPEEAEYSGMPQSAVAAGVADLVLTVAEMPRRILAYLARPGGLSRGTLLPDTDQVLPKIFAVLRDRTRNDFSVYKAKTILRRIERRMSVHQIKSLKQYFQFLQDDQQEIDALFQELLIGVTTFFRDVPALNALWKKGVAPLLKGKGEGYTVRVWVAGCSTGEEAYSLAILLRERMGRLKKRMTAQIFGTDLDKHAIDTARIGLYPAGIASHVSAPRLHQFFTKEDAGYRINNDIRTMVIFAPHNLLLDPLFTKMDVIACRNVLIYLETRAQRQLVQFLHYALKPGGLLLLGASETVITHEDLFACLDRKWKLFIRRDVDRPLDIPERLPRHPPGSLPASQPKPARPLPGEVMSKDTSAIESMLLYRYVPASVVINTRGEIVFIYGRTGSFLEPAPGIPNRQLVEMAREGLRAPLTAALLQVSRGGTDTVTHHAQVRLNGGEIPVRVTVHRINEPERLRGMILVTFEQAPTGEPPAGKAERDRTRRRTERADGGVRQELAYTKHRLQQSLEELGTSNEEFKATNEELQSTNEELQSTNEELETAKEELQSLNEELVTLNSELQGKLDELCSANDDLQNLLNSTEVATVFVDTHLRVRRFTEEAQEIIMLIPGDVGRPLSDLSTKMAYPNLIADTHEVIETLVRKEVEVRTAEGNWYFLRIIPYRTSQNVIDGAVLAFLNITRQKEAEQTSLAAQRFAESIVETVRDPLLVLDADLRIVSTNAAFHDTFRVTSRNIAGQFIYHLGKGQWDIPRLRELLERVLPANTVFEGFELDHVFPGLGRRTFVINARRLDEAGGLPAHILVAFHDASHDGPATPAPQPA